MSNEDGGANTATSTSDDAENTDVGAAPDLQEALGVTPTGNCVRHPNCPVLSLAHNRVMSCRVCFSEEKSVGIRQRKTFAAVVQQLQHSAEADDDSENEEGDQERRRKVKRAHSASMQALILQQPQTMDSIMKRLGQVQNWSLRQKEKEVMSLKLQIQSLEEKFHDAEAKNQEQQQTIWALRRTIQQDMKIIKTMAVQKERERESQSQHGSPMNSSTSSPAKRPNYVSSAGDDSPSVVSPGKIAPPLSSANSVSSSGTPIASPAGKIFMSGPNTPDVDHDSSSNHNNETPDAMQGIVLDNDPLLEKVRQKKKALQSKFEELRAANTGPNAARSSKRGAGANSALSRQSASAHVSGRAPKLAPPPAPAPAPTLGELKRSDNNSMRSQSTRSLDDMVEPPSNQQSTDAAPEPQEGVRTQYWNDEEFASLTADPSKIFASFRGGLLDIPKSPPAASHDNRAKNRPKLQLDTDQMSHLKMPRMRGVGRTLSYQSDDGASLGDALSVGDAQSIASYQSFQSMGSDAQREIPLHKLAATLESLPLSRPLGDETPEQMFEKGKQNEGGEDKSSPSHEQPPPPPLHTSAVPPPKHNARKPKRTVSTDEILDVVPEGNNEDDDFGNASKSNLQYVPALATAPAPAPMPPAPPVASSAGPTGAQNKPARPSLSQDDDQTVDTTPTFFTESGASDALLSGEQRDEQAEKEKFIFTVTGAQCQDKYGDTGMYTGTILVTEGLPHGKGCMNYESGRSYDGAWVSGQWHGHGKLLNPNGDTYEGEFVLDARHGKGEYRWDNGDVYTGDFSYDRRNGNGKFCFHNGNVYEGEFVDGMFEGFGRYDFDDGYYEGEWRQGRYHGDGELKYANGGKYTGEFRESLAHGFGVEMLPDGSKRRGVWERGQPVEFFHKSSTSVADTSSHGG